MGKRPPRKTLDQDDLQSDDDDHQAYKGESKDIDNEEAIAKRKIVTIKRRAPATNDTADKPASSGGFSLFGGPLPAMGSGKKEEEKPKGSLFGNPTTDPKPSGSLFGGGATKLTSNQLFGDSAPAKPAFGSGSLFGGNPPTGSLFGGESKPAGSLFGGDSKPAGSLFGGAPPGNLFGSKPAEGGSLFGNTSGNLFGNNGAPSSLFGEKPKGSTLFGGKPGESIFGQQESIFGKGFGKKDDNQKDNNDEEGDGAYVTPDEPPSVAIEDKVAVKSPFTKLYEREISKYKVDKPADKKKNCGIGKVSIQKCEFGKDDSAKVTIFKIIFKNSIGKILYEGTILNNSKIRSVVEKAHKNQVKISVAYKENEKLTIHYCKLNFQRAEDKNGFEEEFKKVSDFLAKEKK